MNAERIDIVHYDFSAEDGPDATYGVHEFTLSEAFNETFTLELGLVADTSEISAADFLGASVELGILRGDECRRSVCGLVTEAELGGAYDDRRLVRLVVEPAFAALRRQVHSRVFLDMTALEVIEEVLAPLGEYGREWDFTTRARGTATRDYCIQYRESDYDFVVRLLEEEGINFTFRHEPGSHRERLTLVYESADCPALSNLDGSSVAPIVTKRPGTAAVESIQRFDERQRLVSTSTRRLDYDFLEPTSPLAAVGGEADARGRTRRDYQHTERRFIADDVELRNDNALEAHRLDAVLVSGEGIVTTMEPGVTFDLERHLDPALEKRHIVTRMVHRGHAPDVLLHGEAADVGAVRYTNSFECVGTEVPLRPPSHTPKPKAGGPQTAIVVGPAGEEIHTDEHGRICVFFHWDERAARDDTSSCWVRVAQSWAGPQFGAQFIPRVGMEALVLFLEGNPDRPLVVGTVYNGDNQPPFALPDNKTQSGWRTNSSPGGGGSNELRFEDAASQEQVYLHAQRNWDSEVENDRTTYVKANDSLVVDVDRNEEVGGNRSVLVEGEHDETVRKCQRRQVVEHRKSEIGGDESLAVDGERRVRVKGASTAAIGGNSSVEVDENYDESTKKSRTLDAGESLKLTAGADGGFEAGAALALSAGQAFTISAGKDLTIETEKGGTLKTGKDLVVDCGGKTTFKVSDTIVLECGSASITLEKSGAITIKGSDIKVEGSGDVSVKGSTVGSN